MARSKAAKTPVPPEISTGGLALLLGVSVRRIAQLADEKVLVHTGHGSFATIAAVHAFVAHQVGIAEAAAARQIEAASRDGEYSKARTAYMRERAKAAQQKREQAAGDFVPTHVCQAALNNLVVLAKTHGLAIPSRATPLLMECKTPQQINAVLTREIHDWIDKMRESLLVQGDTVTVEEDYQETTRI
jgi:phage terminase Nu1 subunit (DNA packaging protein)